VDLPRTPLRVIVVTYWWRECALCGLSYNRTVRVLAPLRAHCERTWEVNFRRVADAIRDEGDYRHEEWV
jgi:hypothetical protein